MVNTSSADLLGVVFYSLKAKYAKNMYVYEK